MNNADLHMEFDLGGGTNANLAVTIEGRSGDETDLGENSVEGDFLVEHEAKGCLSEDAIIDQSLIQADEPYVNQEFESEAAAHAFYNAYATRVGFVIRVSKLSRSRRDGSAIGRALVCNKEGFRLPDKREKIIRQRAETRVGCRAMILLRKVSSGKWVVTKFERDHTHPLTPGKGRKECIYEQFPNEHDRIRELTQQLAIEKRRSASYKRQLEMLFEHIEEHNESMTKKIQHIVESVKVIEKEEQ